MLRGRHILVVVTGGIAAYKAAELVRLLIRAEATVQVLMTRAATQFVRPLTFQTLSGRPVATELFDLTRESEIGHIGLVREADAAVIAPCTADFIGRLAAGLADDLATTALLAAQPELPLLLVPAMNTAMWRNELVQRNLRTLLDTGRFRAVGPAAGELATRAEGVGPGRMVEPPEIVAALGALLRPPDLENVHVVVTAGPTRERIDPVRFISNRSSGRMGHAIAAVARSRGAKLTLVTGPTALEQGTLAGDEVDVVRVVSAEEMHSAVMALVPEADVVIKAAAVADWRPAAPSAVKLKKTDGPPRIELVRTADILADVLAARQDGRPVVVGFAAETDQVGARARAKLARKPVDLLVVNDVSEAGSGFEVATNRVVLLWPDGRSEELPQLSKSEVAGIILDRVVPLLRRS